MQLAFQVIGNKYVFYGIVDDARANVCFKPSAKAPKSSEEKIKGMKATHILVMMASFLHDLSAYSDESAIRRVVGMHAVSNLVAEQADELVWYTIAQLALKAMVRTRTTTCDGASCFRLQSSYAASRVRQLAPLAAEGEHRAGRLLREHGPEQLPAGGPLEDGGLFDAEVLGHALQ